MELRLGYAFLIKSLNTRLPSVNIVILKAVSSTARNLINSENDAEVNCAGKIYIYDKDSIRYEKAIL